MNSIISINDIVIFLMNTTILFLAFDSSYWAFTLHRHSIWLKNHPIRENIDCDKITHRMLGGASFLVGVHSLLVNLSWLYFKVFYGYHIEMFVLIVGFNLMIIHLLALLARCTDLDKEYWPIVSRCVSNHIISPCRLYLLKKSK